MLVCVLSDVTTGHPESAAKYAYSKKFNGIAHCVEFLIHRFLGFVCLFLALWT